MIKVTCQGICSQQNRKRRVAENKVDTHRYASQKADHVIVVIVSLMKMKEKCLPLVGCL